MTWKFLDRILLGLIAIFLGMIAMRPVFAPQPVSAQAQAPHFYIEPGTTMLHAPAKDRNVVGKVFVDLDTGNIWGFPTITDAPYPVDAIKTAPPTSEPIYLGRYDLSATYGDK